LRFSVILRFFTIGQFFTLKPFKPVVSDRIHICAWEVWGKALKRRFLDLPKAFLAVWTLPDLRTCPRIIASGLFDLQTLGPDHV